jgi:hypothetical protein
MYNYINGNKFLSFIAITIPLCVLWWILGNVFDKDVKENKVLEISKIIELRKPTYRKGPSLVHEYNFEGEKYYGTRGYNETLPLRVGDTLLIGLSSQNPQNYYIAWDTVEAWYGWRC